MLKVAALLSQVSKLSTQTLLNQVTIANEQHIMPSGFRQAKICAQIRRWLLFGGPLLLGGSHRRVVSARPYANSNSRLVFVLYPIAAAALPLRIRLRPLLRSLAP